MFSRVIFTTAFICAFLVSCREPEVPNGGPCSYTIHNLPATIIAIEKRDSATAEILFETETGGRKDTLYYTRCFAGFATAADIQKYDLQMGNQFVYEEHEIIKGTCSPLFYRLTLEKYRTEKK